uniref:Uncharacterized protein n=1 Tax=Rhizophora mucronata TaxID=61149 RepID=A0A2P2PRN6_RHIMU
MEKKRKINLISQRLNRDLLCKPLKRAQNPSFLAHSKSKTEQRAKEF